MNAAQRGAGHQVFTQLDIVWHMIARKLRPLSANAFACTGEEYFRISFCHRVRQSGSLYFVKLFGKRKK